MKYIYIYIYIYINYIDNANNDINYYFLIYNLMHIHECLFCFKTYNFCDDGKH